MLKVENVVCMGGGGLVPLQVCWCKAGAVFIKHLTKPSLEGILIEGEGTLKLTSLY